MGGKCAGILGLVRGRVGMQVEGWGVGLGLAGLSPGYDVLALTLALVLALALALALTPRLRRAAYSQRRLSSKTPRSESAQKGG